MSDLIKRWGLLIGVGASVLALDQTVKHLVTERLGLGQSWEPIPAIGDYIRITRSYNTGAAFGMFPFASDLFLILALVTVVIFIISYPRLPAGAYLSRVAIALIGGGALSNAIDRLRFEHVVDYVHVQLSPALSNISNFADHAITVGVFLLLLDQWLGERRRIAEQAIVGSPEVQVDAPALSESEPAGADTPVSSAEAIVSSDSDDPPGPEMLSD